MQQRDELADLPFPGCWNFFGGLAEETESTEEALERELTEELGCVPGRFEPELFQWEWKSDWASTNNHFFPVRNEMEISRLVLNEGQGFAWLSVEDLVERPLTPAVYETFSRVAKFLSDLRPDLANRIEDRLLSFNNLQKKNSRVFYAKENPCGLSRQQIFLLKELASLRNIPVFRVCLHTDDQCDIHEMLMVHTAPTSVGPLKQCKTSLSYHIIEGSLEIDLHEDRGRNTRKFVLGKNNPCTDRLSSLRLRADEYRTVRSTTPFAMFLEVASGPFQDGDTQWLNIERQIHD